MGELRAPPAEAGRPLTGGQFTAWGGNYYMDCTVTGDSRTRHRYRNTQTDVRVRLSVSPVRTACSLLVPLHIVHITR